MARQQSTQPVPRSVSRRTQKPEQAANPKTRRARPRPPSPPPSFKERLALANHLSVSANQGMAKTLASDEDRAVRFALATNPTIFESPDVCSLLSSDPDIFVRMVLADNLAHPLHSVASSV